MRKHVRALLVTAAPDDCTRWSLAVRDDLSLAPRCPGSIADALVLVATHAFDVAVIATALTDGSYRDLLRALQLAREDLPIVVVGELDHDGVRDALMLGAIDVVAQNDLVRLGPAVARALRDAVLGTLLRRTRAEATLLDEALRRTRDELAIVAVDDGGAVAVYATRTDLIGRPLTELPFVRDGDEADELAAAVDALRSTRVALACGSVSVEPLSAPGSERRFVAVTLDRGERFAPGDRDPVTGLPQRPAFERAAQAALADTERDGTSLAVLFLDVDRFRVVNELGEHAAGDVVLRQIAQRLHASLPDAYAARFGGDEFVLLCVEDVPGAARAAADRALAAFAAPFDVGGKLVYLTASIGIAHAPDDAGDVATLIGTAEAAVFEAKRLGRNNVRWYRPPGPSTSLERAMLRRDLHFAIARDELELYYQPMYDIETRAIHGVEALLRWRHPVRGMIAPDRFIPIAEESGLIETIGAWVLERAIAQVRMWSDIGIPSMRVCVNVSARQFESETLPALISALLARYAVAAACLEIEITESSIMRDVTAAGRLLRRLRELGVSVSIDDFGTGYTSLSFLKRFPVDVLKIDRSFVADVADGGFDGAVIRAVTTLARALGMRTVAEGVEVQAQLDHLRTLDCDVVQGFLFSQPMSAAACTPLLARGSAPRQGAGPPRRIGVGRGRPQV